MMSDDEVNIVIRLVGEQVVLGQWCVAASDGIQFGFCKNIVLFFNIVSARSACQPVVGADFGLYFDGL